MEYKIMKDLSICLDFLKMEIMTDIPDEKMQTDFVRLRMLVAMYRQIDRQQEKLFMNPYTLMIETVVADILTEQQKDSPDRDHLRRLLRLEDVLFRLN